MASASIHASTGFIQKYYHFPDGWSLPSGRRHRPFARTTRAKGRCAPSTLREIPPERLHVALDTRVQRSHELLAGGILSHELFVPRIADEAHLGEDGRHIRADQHDKGG